MRFDRRRCFRRTSLAPLIAHRAVPGGVTLGRSGVRCLRLSGLRLRHLGAALRGWGGDRYLLLRLTLRRVRGFVGARGRHAFASAVIGRLF